MNSDFSDDMDLLQLERELQSLTPAAPRRELVQAIKARMEPVPRRVQRSRSRAVTFPWRRMVAPAAAAAAAVVVFNLDDDRREGPGPRPENNGNTTSSIKWEPMRMLPEYRRLLDQGYFLTQNMEFIPPGYASQYNARLMPFPVQNGSLVSDSVSSHNHFIVPAGYGSGPMNFTVH